VVIAFDYALALVSGALLALSFPRYGHPAFAWIALVPLLVALTGWNGRTPSIGEGRGASAQPPLRAFLLGLATGFVYFAGTLYWTGTVIRTFGGIPLPAAVLGVVLLALYQGFFPCALCAALEPVDRARGRQGTPIRSRGVGRHRVLPRCCARRLSLGPAWQQPGHGLTCRSARERRRRLRRFGARRVDQRDRLRTPRSPPGHDVSLQSRREQVVLGATAMWGTLRIADGTLTA
jgi:hypothetical protein